MQEDEENNLDLQLWHACAGPMVKIPEVNSTVFYFPQGHLEHGQVEATDDFLAEGYPAKILCRVESVKHLAERETKEAYLKMRLIPEKNKDAVELENSSVSVSEPKNAKKPDSFYAKTLYASDAIQGAGLHISQEVADAFFPQLDDQDSNKFPVDDIHGVTWEFEHIYQKDQQKHFLRAEWHSFRRETDLKEGDSILFLKSENRNLRVGVHRKSRGNADEIMQVVKLANSGEAFDVVYYPGPDRREFCVKAAAVKKAVEEASLGKRLTMGYENYLSNEVARRISWYEGGITAIKESDPKWPDSSWKQLLVMWDHPNRNSESKFTYPARVNPWMVKIQDIEITPPKKKLRVAGPTKR